MAQSGFFNRLGAGVGRFFGSFRSGYNESLGRRGSRVVSSLVDESQYRSFGESALGYHAMRRAVQNSWVYSAISLISRELSSSNLQVVEYKGVDESPIHIANHPFEQLLRRPNAYLTGEFLWQFTSWWLELHGNSYWFLVFDDIGKLVEIWPLPAESVEPIPVRDGVGLMGGYEYRANGQIFNIPPQYIVHFMYPNPFDVFRGMSPLTAAMLGVDTDLAMARWNSTFFGRDNTMPSAIINITNGDEAREIDQSDIDALKDDLASNYAAASRKTAVTSVAQLQVEQLGWSQRDMDYTEGRQFTKEEIYEIYGIPPGLYDPNSTYANSDNADRVFRDKKLWPVLRLIAAQLTTSLIIPLYGPGYAAAFEDPRTGNRELNLQEIQTAQTFFTIDEIREKYYGAEPLPKGRGELLSGDERPMNGGPALSGGGDFDALVEGMTKQPEAEEKPEEKPENGPDNLEEDEHAAALDDLKKWRKKALKSWKRHGVYRTAFCSIALPEDLLISTHLRLREAASEDGIKAIFEEGRRRLVDQASIKAPLGKLARPWTIWQNNLYNSIMVFAEAEKQRIRRLIEKKKDSFVADESFWSDYRRRLRAAIAAPAMRLALLGALHAKRRMPKNVQDMVDWNLANTSAIRWAQQYANGVVSTIVDTLSSDLKKEVADWAVAGETTPQLVTRILARVGSRDKAEQVAETEATRIYAEGSDQAWQAAGVPPIAKKAPAHVRCRCYHQPKRLANGEWVVIWYTARDEKVCKQPLEVPWQTQPVKGCRALHGIIVSQGQYLGQKFTDVARRVKA